MSTSEHQSESHLLVQWMVTLAVSVLCCAVLFLLFGGYIMDLQVKSAVAAVRLDVLRDQQMQLSAELTYLRRTAQAAVTHSSPAPAPVSAPDQASPETATVPAPAAQ